MLCSEKTELAVAEHSPVEEEHRYPIEDPSVETVKTVEEKGRRMTIS